MTGSKKEFKNFMREVFSENGQGSSKRIVGTLALLVSLGCVTFLTVTVGCSDCVENLLEVVIIAACSLLGVSSITSIWKKGSNDKEEKENE